MNGQGRADEPHLFSRGRPDQRVFQSIRSTAVPGNERYGFWRDAVIRGFELAPPDDLQKDDFIASVTSLALPTGEMHYAVADGYEGARTRERIVADGEEALVLFYLLEGWAEAEDDEAGLVIRPGQFYLLDTARPSALRFGRRHRVVQLDLPRQPLAAAFPKGLPSTIAVTRALNRSGLSRLLGAHLAMFPAQVGALDPGEQLGLLEASEGFAITTIETALGRVIGNEATRDDGLFAAAQRHIRLNIASRSLNATRVAAAIGCSRGTLYRIFGAHELSVAEHIRELRLNRLRTLLMRAPRSIPISRLAQRCGLHDAPNVNRMFRRRFGIAPSDLRRS